MDQLLRLYSFSKANQFQPTGFQLTFTTTGGLHAIQKDGQAMSMVWNGFVNVLNQQCVKKQTEESDTSFAMGMTVTLQAHLLQNYIILIILPPHLSQYTQRLDLRMFGPLKTAISVELSRVISTGVA
jgi:hypothetical protein